MWVKWQHTYAHGPEEEWHWHYLGQCNKTDAEEYIQEELVPMWRESGEQWSELYRGVEFELVEQAPESVIREKIKQEEARIERATKNLKVWTSLLNSPKSPS